MKDNEILRSMMGNFGIKDALEIRFITPKKLLVKEETKDTMYEKVESLLIMVMPSGSPTIDINYEGENGGESSISTSISNYKGITVLD